ncbi:MAG: InlB B-repeat-containing protein, partial [Ruminococcus sp.]|nr:InlB B-repeat-containing protein [Ruminococcus sp.]
TEGGNETQQGKTEEPKTENGSVAQEADTEGGNETVQGKTEEQVAETDNEAEIEIMEASEEIMLAEETVTAPDTVTTSDQTWETCTLSGTYTIQSGVTVTLMGPLTVEGEVTIMGGGKLVRGAAGAYFDVGSGDKLTLQNIEVDGASLSSSYSMISVTGGGAVELLQGSRLHHCYKTSQDGAALYISGGNAVLRDAAIEDCQSTSYGGAIYMYNGSSLTIYSGSYSRNATTSTSSYGGGFLYNRGSTVTIYGGSFIGNTSEGIGGCIYNTGIANTATYLYGGYFSGNKSSYATRTGSGAVFYSSRNTADTTIQLSGDVQFCGDGTEGSGTDGVFLDIGTGAERKAKISSELKYPLALYLEASEGRAIAEGVEGYQLQKKDMKKITFTDAGSSGSKWYAKLDEENNQVVLTATNPGYDLLYVTYGANGGEGTVSDSNGYNESEMVTLQSGDVLKREGYRFAGWNTKRDGTGTAYSAGDTFSIVEDVMLYAQWELAHIHAVSVDCSQVSGSKESFAVLYDGISENGVLSAGSYYLDADCYLATPIIINSGVTVNLCLNGHKLEYTGSGENAIVVNGTLKLCDCNGSHGSYTFTSPATNGTVTVNGGVITRSQKVNAVGSGIRVYGTCYMCGGSIAGISDTGDSRIDDSHGAVRVEGTFYMYGGAITHNRSGCGGGVNVCGDNAVFQLIGGSVSYNYADYDDGGGICLNDNGSFVMSGGEVRGNRAKSGGGGIECYGNGNSADAVTIMGGIITGNTTGGDVGGGMKCGDINRPLTISGNAKITGNSNQNGAESNLYLCDGKTVNVVDGFNGMVGVTMENTPTEEASVDITGTNNGDYSQYFYSDKSAYKIVDNKHVLQLVLPDTIPPTGSITIDSNSWKSFLNTITFGLFFKETKTVTITAADKGSGVDKVYYYTSENKLTLADVQALEASDWVEGHSFSISPDSKCIIYAKITDMDGNVAYISSDGLVFDGTAPIISGVMDGETYRIPPTVTVTDAHLKSVKVDGKEVTLTNGIFTLKAAEGQQTIVAVDEAGNTATVTVTVKTVAENVADAKAIVENVLANYTATNDSTKQELQEKIDAALREAFGNAGIGDVTVTVGEFAKTEATTSEVGSISGSITVSSGSGTDIVTDSVAINKPIAKLPVTDADKVEAAKEIVENVLANYTATNDSTKEELQNKIDAVLAIAALGNAGIGDVTVTVGELTKTEATKDEAGSLSGSITVSCGSGTDIVTDSVAINKPIAKLPVTDADKVEAAKEIVENVLANYTATNDSTKEELQNKIDAVLAIAALGNAGIGDVTVTVGEFTKIEATTSEEGSLSGSITISCGSGTDIVTDSVAVNKPIAKLPVTDADKVEAAKEIVENVLADYTATNDSTKEELQNKIDAVLAIAALGNAGIGDVTVTVGEFTKIEATTSEEGSLSGSITISCGSGTDIVTDSVAVNKPIAKLPVTDADKVEAAKEIVENVLADYTATNDSTKEELQEKIDAALREAFGNAGIGDVTVTVGELAKTEATTSEAGSLSGSITVSCGSETETIAISRTIPKKEDTESTETTESTESTETTESTESTETTEDTGGKESGAISANVHKDDKAPTTKLSTPVKELKDLLLTEAEKKQVADGMNINIVLDVKDASGSVSDEDKATVNAVLHDYTVGQYIDISLYKLVGENRTDITETSKKLTIMIYIPDNLRNVDGKTIRNFAVIRVHDGNADILSDLDESADTITIESDRFSTYVIIYKDMAKGEGGGNNNEKTDKDGTQNKTDQSPDTADNTPIEFVATLAMISGFTYLLLWFSDHKRGMTEKTKKELVSRLVEWAKQGGTVRRLLALAAIFVLLAYYHSIGKETDVEWQEVYAK